MAVKKKRFKLDVEEKKARLDIRIRETLRIQLEDFCRKNKIKITEAVTRALEQFIASNQSTDNK